MSATREKPARRPYNRTRLTAGEMTELWLGGMSGKEIAKGAGVDGARVTQMITEHTGMRPLDYRIHCGWIDQRTPPELADRIAAFARQHLTKTQKWIARQVGVTPKRLSTILESRGVELQTVHMQRFNTPEEIAEIGRRYREGATTVELAQDLDTDEHTIRKRLDLAGVERRGHSSRAGRALWS